MACTDSYNRYLVSLVARFTAHYVLTLISKLCRVAFYYLHNIRLIPKNLSEEPTEMFVYSFIPFIAPKYHHPALHYYEAPEICTTLHATREALCVKTFDKIKEPESRLRHLIPTTRAFAHDRS